MTARRAFDRNATITAIIALAIVFFLAVTVLSAHALKVVRLDLTQDGLYTLSDGTRTVLKDIEEPITLRLYASRLLVEHAPQYANYGARVRELLDQYVHLSGGKLRLQVFNPTPYSPEEDEAVAAGMQGVRVNRAGDRAYLGLIAANSTDDEEVVPFFDVEREPYLEYDLTKMIFNLAHPKKKVIGVLSELPMQGDMRRFGPWSITNQMRQFFDLRFLEYTTDAIDKDVDVLMIVHPSGLSERTQYAIDQYLLRGGKAMIFVDPHSEVAATSPMGEGMGPNPSTIQKLFDAWGIEFNTEVFVGDLGNAMRVQAMSEGRAMPVDYVAWVGFGPESINRDDVITSQVERLNFGSAGSFTVKDGKLTATPLVTSSKRSMQITVSQVAFQHNPVKLLQGFVPENRSFMIAARLRGKLDTAFPDGPPPDKSKDAKTPPVTAGKAEEAKAETKPAPGQIKQSAEPVNIILVADTDMLTDRMWIQTRDVMGQRVGIPTANNGDFVINALDNLIGSNALISLRGRGFSARPFHRLENLQREAEFKFRKTEQGLQNKIKEVEEKLANLQKEEGAEGGTIMSDRQKATMEQFRTELVDARRELRKVQHALREDIESLDTGLKILNIWAMPGIVSIVAIVSAVARQRRRRPQSTREPPAQHVQA